MLDGIAVWAREMSRPENLRSPTALAHEAARTHRMADLFEAPSPTRFCSPNRTWRNSCWP